jgi:hypothetical protein
VNQPRVPAGNPHGGEWTSSGTYSSRGDWKIEKPTWDNVAEARGKFAKENNGIGSVHDEESGAFFETLRAWHNSGNIKPLKQYAKNNPQQFQHMQRAMRFNAWLDSDTHQDFHTWEAGSVQIHRGVAPSSTAAGHVETGYSWTLSDETAKHFAREGTSRIGWHDLSGPMGHVISKTVKVKDIFAYSNAQGEKEVILV